MTWRVVVADRLAGSGLDLLAQTPEIEVVSVAGKPREDLDRALAGAHALIVRSETRVTAGLLARAPHLRVVARAGTGVDTIDVHAATRRGIAVMNAPGANTVSAGEHALGLLLALVRRIPDAAAAMRQGQWDRKRFEGTELRGKTMGVVGLGRIGGHVAQLARAFGMQVVGHDPYLLPERAAELHVRLLPLEALLRAQVDDVLAIEQRQIWGRSVAFGGRLRVPASTAVDLLRGRLEAQGYTPFLRQERGTTWVHALPRADVTGRPNPWINLGLFLATVLTTLSAGALSFGDVPLGELLVRPIRLLAGRATADGVEVAGLYWHFVDLVWVFIFTLFYLL